MEEQELSCWIDLPSWMPSIMRFVQRMVFSESTLSQYWPLSTSHNVLQMYQEVQHALQTAGKEDSVVVTVITGAGDYYCSGNDLSNFAQIPPEGPQKLAAEGKKILQWVMSLLLLVLRVSVFVPTSFHPSLSLSDKFLLPCLFAGSSSLPSFSFQSLW